MIDTKLTDTQIEEEVNKLSAQIDSLYEQKDMYLKELRDREDKKVQVTNDILHLSDGVSIIAVAKHLDYHLSMIKVFDKITNDRGGISYFLHDYRVDDYELSYRVCRAWSNRYIFHNMIDSYELYATDSPSTIKQLIDSFTSLSVTVENYKQLVTSMVMGSVVGHIST